MTAEVIIFPIAKLPPERPLRVRDNVGFLIGTAARMAQLGKGPEDLPASMHPRTRQLIGRLIEIFGASASNGNPAA